MIPRNRMKSVGRTLGVLGALLEIVSSLYLIQVAVVPYLSISTSGIGFVGAGASLGAENAPIVLFWSLVIIMASLLSGYGARTERVRLVWVFAVAFAVFAFLAGFSIGPVVVPTAVVLLCSGIALTRGRSDGERETSPTA